MVGVFLQCLSSSNLFSMDPIAREAQQVVTSDLYSQLGQFWYLLKRSCLEVFGFLPYYQLFRGLPFLHNHLTEAWSALVQGVCLSRRTGSCLMALPIVNCLDCLPFCMFISLRYKPSWFRCKQACWTRVFGFLNYQQLLPESAADVF